MSSVTTSENSPLMEACTLDLYKKNIFRITGLSVDATSKEVSRQVQKLQMLEEMGGNAAIPKTAFALADQHTNDEIRAALSRMKEPEHRLVDEFFWFWPEEFGKSNEDPAIQAMLSGDRDGAYQLWKHREMSGSHVAQHNMAIFYHMHAVDWTNFHISSSIDGDQDVEIQRNWRKAFERWEPIIESDDLWDMLKERVRSLDDEALTTGVVRRMLRQLPEALDRVNAESALKLAEQGRMDWARFHVNFMRETHQGLDDVDSTSELVLEPTKKRVEQHLELFLSEVKNSPEEGARLANELLTQCRPMMNLFDLFHGVDAHQRDDLFDKVVLAILQMTISYQQSTSDDESSLQLLREAYKFASASHLRERLVKNIKTMEGNIVHTEAEVYFRYLESIQRSKSSASAKIHRVKKQVISQLPHLASTFGSNSELYRDLVNAISITLRNISLAVYNDEEDAGTAIDAVRLALKLANDSSVIDRLKDDLNALIAIESNRRQSQAIESNQKQWNRTITIRSDEFQIHEDFVRYNSTILKTANITDIRFGIHRQIRTGREISTYDIGLHGNGVSIKVDCERMSPSQNQAIVESLSHLIIPNVVKRLVEDVKCHGKPLGVGSLTLTKNGLECTTGVLAWKKQHLVPYRNILIASDAGEVIVSIGHPANTAVTLSPRTVNNAVLLENMVDRMLENN